MLQANNPQFQELANALLGASHLLLRHPLRGDPEPAAFAVLALVGQDPRARPSDLVGRMRLDLSTISRHIRTLESAGYLSKVKDSQDGRSCRLQLTATGRAALRETAVRRAAFFRRATAHWPGKDFRLLVALLSRLARDLKACAAS